MISVSDVNLTFQTNDGPVNALKNVSMEVNEEILYPLLDHLDVAKQLFLELLQHLRPLQQAG